MIGKNGKNLAMEILEKMVAEDAFALAAERFCQEPSDDCWEAQLNLREVYAKLLEARRALK